MTKRFLDFFFFLTAVSCVVGKIAYVTYANATRTTLADGWLFAFSTTWLTDYSCGYVRRGLCGSVIKWIYLNFGIEPQFCIAIFSLSAFIALSCVVFVVFRRRGWNWWIVMLSICLGGISSANKDALVCLFCVLCYWLYERVDRPLWRYGLVNLFSIVLIHIHEIGFFLVIPMLVLLAIGDKRLPLAPLIRPLVWMPLLSAFLLIATHRGGEDVACGIVQNWQSVFSPWWEGVKLHGVYADVGSNGKHLVGLSLKIMTDKCCGVPNVVFLGIEVILALIVILRLPFIRRTESVDLFSVLCLFQILTILPVLPFFVDYSRLIGFCSLSMLLCYGIISHSRFKSSIDALSACLPVCVGGGLYRYVMRIPPWLVAVFALCVGMSMTGFSFRICLGRSAIGTVFHSLVWDVIKSKGDISQWWNLQPK